MTRLSLSLIPDENPHISALHLAVFSWAASRVLDADFLLHFPNATKANGFLEALEWLGVDWDEAPIVGDVPDVSYSVVTSEQTAVSLQPNRSAIIIPALVDEEKRPLPQRGYLLEDFQERGYLPQALFNFLILQGWAPAAGSEILDKWQIRKSFDLTGIKTEPVPFNWKQLDRINKHYVNKMGVTQLAEAIRPFLEDAYGHLPMAGGWLEKVTAVIQPHLTTLEDSIEAAEWALSDAFQISPEAKTALAQQANRQTLKQLIAEIATIVLLDEQTAKSILNHLPPEAHAPIRASLMGQLDGPDVPFIMSILGKQETLQRVAAQLR